MTGRFIAFVGPSGVGKDSVMEGIAARSDKAVLARRVITRPSEAAGEDFAGVDMDSFARMRDDGEFALWWAAHGLSYGISGNVRAQIDAGHDVLANLSRRIIGQALVMFPDMIVISLSAERSILAQRLSARGREDESDIARRLDRGAFPIAEQVIAHHVSNNGPLDETVAAVLALLYPVRT